MATKNTTGDYPIIVSDPDGPYFARPVDDDEGYEFPWVVIHVGSGDHVTEGTEEVVGRVVDMLNRRALREDPPTL